MVVGNEVFETVTDSKAPTQRFTHHSGTRCNQGRVANRGRDEQQGVGVGGGGGAGGARGGLDVCWDIWG